MELDDLETFLALCAEGSITALGRRLGVPKSTVSRRLARLEEDLGAALVERTAEGVELTERGREVRAQGLRVMAEVSRLRSPDHGPSLVRIAASPELAEAEDVLVMLEAFRARHPATTVDLVSTGARLDLASAAIDLALRIHVSPLTGEATLMTRRIGELRGHLFAAPRLLLAHGTPAEPRALERLPLITIGGGVLRDEWPLHHDTEAPIRVRVQPAFRATDLPLLRRMAVRGQGVTLLPDFMVSADLASGALVPVLPQWRSPPVHVSALWREDRVLVPAIRDLLDLLPDLAGRLARW